MGSFGAEHELSQTLVAAGNSLLNPPPSTDALLTLLDEIESLLSNVEQDPPMSMQDALLPSMKALISVDLLRHPDPDVRVSVVSCLTEITRITAPEAPYDDDQMKEIFQLTVEAFEKLADLSCRNYKKAELILDTVSKVRSCLVMLDLECDKLILEMFQNLLKIISPDHPQAVFLAIEMIMITVLDESEEVSRDLLDILLACVKKENENIPKTSWRLVENVLSRCACQLKPYITDALKSTGDSLEMYSPVVSLICQSESGTTKKRKLVGSKENEAEEKRSTRHAVPSSSLEETLDLGHSRKRIRSGNNSRSLLKVKQSSKPWQPKSTNAETESGSTLRKKRRKPNALLNLVEGYDHSWVSGERDSVKMPSSKKMHGKGLESSSLGKTPFPEECTSLPSKAGQTTQSVVISLPSPYRILRGPHKRSRARFEEIDQDESSLPSHTTKKDTSSIHAKRKGSPSAHTFINTELSDEEYLVIANQEGFEETEHGRKAAKSGKRGFLQNHLEKPSMKKQLTGAKKVKSSGKGSAIRSEVKKTHTDGSTVVSGSSKSKKMVSQIETRLEETPKSHPKRKRTARKEVDTETPDLGAELVSKKIKVWWPLDKTFYEGVIKSYDNENKKHLVLYSDGEKELLNLKRQRWEFVEDSSSGEADLETDALESMTISGILQSQKAHKNRNASASVELETTISSEIKSSKGTMKKKDAEGQFKKQGRRVKDKAMKKSTSESMAESEELGTREGKNLKSLKELNAEPHRAETDTDQNQKSTNAQESVINEEVNRESRSDPNAESISMEEDPKSTKETNAETENEGEDLKSLKEPNTEGNEAMTVARKGDEDNETQTNMSENEKPESRVQGDDLKCAEEINAESVEPEECE